MSPLRAFQAERPVCLSRTPVPALRDRTQWGSGAASQRHDARHSMCHTHRVPHAASLPPDDLRLAMAVYQLRSVRTAAAQRIMAEYFMGQEDGMYPDTLGWGAPPPTASRRLRRAYAKQYRWGYRVHRACVRSTPEQLEAALDVLAHHHGQEWQSLDDPVRIVAGIEGRYRKYKRTRKGWRGFLKDFAATERTRDGAIKLQPHEVAPQPAKLRERLLRTQSPATTQQADTR
jgi:hypothetical protein